MFILFFVLTKSVLFTMIIENNGTAQLSIFNSDSLEVLPYADVPLRYLLPSCPRIDNMLYMININRSGYTFFNQIDILTGKILNITELRISQLIIGHDNDIIGTTIQKNPPIGNEAIGQVIRDMVIVKYNFTTDTIFPVVSYFKEIDSYIVFVAFIRKKPGEILILRNWKIHNIFIIPGFYQFLTFSFLIDNQLYFFMRDRTELETGLYKFDIVNGNATRRVTFGNSLVLSSYANKTELKIYAVVTDMDVCSWVEINLITGNCSRREIPCGYMCIICTKSDS